ncbi:MAG: hypothetical protein WA628_24790 [Terriglobales bacterium]
MMEVERQAPAVPDSSDSIEGLPLLPPLPPPAVPSVGVRWSQALPGAALAGAFSLLAGIIPFAIFGPAFMAGGALAVMLYRRHVKDSLPSPRDGAQIGAASGGFGFLFFAIVVVATLVYRPEELRQPMLHKVAQSVARGYDPQKIDQMQQALKTPQGLTLFVGFGLFMLFLIFVVGSSIGGALYAAWLRKRLQL